MPPPFSTTPHINTTAQQLPFRNRHHKNPTIQMPPQPPQNGPQEKDTSRPPRCQQALFCNAEKCLTGVRSANDKKQQAKQVASNAAAEGYVAVKAKYLNSNETN